MHSLRFSKETSGKKSLFFKNPHATVRRQKKSKIKNKKSKSIKNQLAKKPKIKK